MNGVDRELFTPCPPDENLKQTWGVAGQFVCGYVGTIGMACGLHVVLDAAAMLKQRAVDDVVFLLVGDGAQRAPLVDQAEARGLDNVVFTGRQPKAMMPGYLAIMDVCLVHLRKTDLFSTVMPSKIFEAAAMGRPIVNGVAGFAAEFIDKAGAGVNIESENAKQLVESILALKSDPLLRDSLGRSGRQYVTAHYDREKLAADYLAVLEKVSGAGED